METIYLIVLGALGFLAIIDLVVGVSNDAVNFLNSAIGSKVFSLRKILIFTSIGIILGALSSSGLMEVARKGVMNPGAFHFDEIMLIFVAVMLADIVLLDIFNNLGLPTSTTVSILFDLLGATTAAALLKIGFDGVEGIGHLGKYLNIKSAVVIISVIFSSVFIAFTMGMIVQFITRLIFTFRYYKTSNFKVAFFSGLSFSAITYFILFKGFQSSTFFQSNSSFFENNFYAFFLSIFFIWVLICYILIKFFKVRILKWIIMAGTFSIALAFAGNDLVNFIGVPVAALNAFEFWRASGMEPDQMYMTALAGDVPTPTIILLLASTVMVLTMWFSKKSRNITMTELNLAKQHHDGYERFQPNFMSRGVVRFAVLLNKTVTDIVPEPVQRYIDKRFSIPKNHRTIKGDKDDLPSFDMMRAAVNLVLSGILISLGTSLKLPLSTTYVTFMVAMGTSLSDRAWGRETGVYRVAGVLRVITGWFATAMCAFLISATFMTILFFGKFTAMIFLFAFVAFILVRNYTSFVKKMKAEKKAIEAMKKEVKDLHSAIEDNSEHVLDVMRSARKLYKNFISDLHDENLKKLTKSDKNTKKLHKEVIHLKGSIYYYIKSMLKTSVRAGVFYNDVLEYIEDISASLRTISQNTYIHVFNNHKRLKKVQIEELHKVQNQMHDIFSQIIVLIEEKKYNSLSEVIYQKDYLELEIDKLIEKQIQRIKDSETSQKNTLLYFSILNETKVIIRDTRFLITAYIQFFNYLKKIEKK